MLQETRRPSGRFRAIVDDEVRFIRSWMEKPLTTGAVSPSGRFLARAMASRVDVSLDGPVIELGPGTGPVTKALLGHGIAPERIHAVEYNPAFANLLKTRFSAINVIVGDAYGLEKTLQDRVDGPFSAIVSSLPLFTRPAPDRRRLMEQAMRLLKPGAPFIQFSYALVPPLPASPGEWTLEVSPWILRNLPPARVWTYRSDAGA